MTVDDKEVLAGLGFKKKPKSIIMVLGVGGAGGNAVNHMFDMGIADVTFMVCNTDRQALQASPIPIKIQLGTGLGAGNDPNKGRQAAIESLDEIVIRFEQEGTQMVFITAGMGGGTGTGAAPVIAKAARDKGILTVGIVTLPFVAEGKKRVDQATKGLEELKKNVDSIVVIHNDNISKIYGSLPLEDAFGKADDILAMAAKGITDLINRSRLVNVDFADVQAVMSDGGLALMGSSRANGELVDIERMAEEALTSPLLNHQEIRGAKDILCNLSFSPNMVSMDTQVKVLEYIQKRASRGIGDYSSNIIWGAGVDHSLNEEVVLTIVATGFDNINQFTAKESGRRSDTGLTGLHPKHGSLQGNIIKVHKKRTAYENLEKYLNTPAYIRRNIKLNMDTSAAKSSRVAMKEEEQPPQPPKETTLF